MMSNPVLEVQEICKIFPGVVANEDVSLSLAVSYTHLTLPTTHDV